MAARALSRMTVAGLIAGIVLVNAAAPAVGEVRAPRRGAGSCADVLLLGARGSGESPGSSVGTRVGGLFSAVQSDLHGRRTTTRAAVTKAEGYQAHGVGGYLVPPSVAGVITYTRGMDTGIGATIKHLTQNAAACPHEHVVLAGYSQGAIVMHQVVNRLVEQGRSGLVKRIAAVGLIADGDRVRNSKAHRLGTAAVTGRGIRPTVHVPLHVKDVASAVTGRTWELCMHSDLVCDTSRHFLTGISIHTGKSYLASSKYIKKLASLITARLLTYAKGAPTTPTSWPVHDQEGTTVLWAWFGSNFEFPDWVSCTNAVDWCIAGIGSQVHVIEIDGLIDVTEVPKKTDNPYAELTGIGFTPTQAKQLLRPN